MRRLHRRARNVWIIGVWRASSKQEAIVAVRRLDHVQLDLFSRRAQRVGELLRARGRIQPVGAERNEQRSRHHLAQRVHEISAAVLPREIEVGQRTRRVQISVRIEPPDERVRLVPEVVFDLELGVGQGVANVVGELQAPSELGAERHRGQIRDVANHPRHAHAGVRLAAGAVVVAALPRRVGHDRAPRDRVPGDALRLERVGAGDRDDRVDLIRVEDGPFERLHAAE